MGLISSLLALILPTPEAGDSMALAQSVQRPRADAAELAAPAPRPAHENNGRGISWLLVTNTFRPQEQQQVRIEQRTTIRISPRSLPPHASLLMDLPQGEVEPRFRERHFGKCLPVNGIAGVQSAGGSRLVLFMRDRRMVMASLERACRARDFYSGFYVERSLDGRLCVDRDTLLSRNGANCRITRLRQLIAEDD